jgi:hypothetical protein
MTVRRGRKPAVQGKSSMPATAMSAGQRSSISENRNAAMAQGDEMAHDRLHGRMIIHHDRVGFDADEFAVDADDRQSVDDHILDDVIVAARWRNDETVDALLREHVEIHALLVAAFLSVAENEYSRRRPDGRRLRRPVRDRRRKIGDIRNHNADRVGRTSSKAARDAVRARLLDASLVSTGHKARAVEHMGHGCWPFCCPRSSSRPPSRPVGRDRSNRHDNVLHGRRVGLFQAKPLPGGAPFLPSHFRWPSTVLLCLDVRPLIRAIFSALR